MCYSYIAKKKSRQNRSRTRKHKVSIVKLLGEMTKKQGNIANQFDFTQRYESYNGNDLVIMSGRKSTEQETKISMKNVNKNKRRQPPTLMPFSQHLIMRA